MWGFGGSAQSLSGGLSALRGRTDWGQAGKQTVDRKWQRCDACHLLFVREAFLSKREKTKNIWVAFQKVSAFSAFRIWSQSYKKKERRISSAALLKAHVGCIWNRTVNRRQHKQALTLIQLIIKVYCLHSILLCTSEAESSTLWWTASRVRETFTAPEL